MFRFIIAALRRLWLKYPPRNQCKSNARVSRGKYKCNGCKKLFGPKFIQVDHIVPIGKFVSYDKFVEKLFCNISNLQVLCLDCHKAKSAKERKK